MKTKAVFKDAQRALDEGRVKEQGLKDIIGFCFDSEQSVESFVRICLKKKKTRWMLNRLEWFTELADSQKYDSVKTFFLIAMAETNIKLFENRFKDNSNETIDVKKFFSRFSQQDKDELRKYFFETDEFLKKKSFHFDKVVDILLNVRHRLVHGKNHYDFRFHDGSDTLMNIIFGQIGTQNKKKSIKYKLEITYKSFREMMIKNAVENLKLA